MSFNVSRFRTAFGGEAEYGNQHLSFWRNAFGESILEPELSREVRALSGERNEAFFWEGALQIAGRLERSNRTELAGRIYTAILGTEAPSELRARAQSRLGGLTGRGSFALRAESLLRTLARETTDPAMLAAMGVAGASYRAVRLFSLSRFAAAPASWATRGLAAQTFAGLSGFAVEAPAFALAARWGHEVLGRPQDWRTEALGNSLVSSFLVLGALKFSAWMGGGLSRAALGEGAGLGTRITRGLFTQAGMLGGIMLGHKLEAGLGLRSARSGGDTFVDSLVTLLQFNVAGRMTRDVFGERFRRWESGMELQTQALSHFNGMPRPVFGWGEAYAAPGGVSERLPQLISRPQILMMNGRPPEGSPSEPLDADWGSLSLDSVFPSAAAESRSESSVERAAEILSRTEEPLEKLAEILDWSDPQERRDILRQTLRNAPVETVIDRVTQLTGLKDPMRGGMHAIRLLHSLYLETWGIRSGGLHQAVSDISSRLPIEADRLSRWERAKERLKAAWMESGAADASMETELENFYDASFPSSLVERALFLSRESRSASGQQHHELGGFIYSELGSRYLKSKDSLDEFMTVSHLARNLVETGHIVRGRSLLFRSLHSMAELDSPAVPPGLTKFLIRHVDAQIDALDRSLRVASSAATPSPGNFDWLQEPEALQAKIRPLGLFLTLRERSREAAINENVERAERFITLARSLLRNAVLDPRLARLDDSLTDWSLLFLRERFLDAATPRQAAEEWNAPLAELVDRLVRAKDFEGAYRTLHDFHQLGLGDPMTFRNIVISLTTTVEIRNNHEKNTRDTSLLQRLADFEQRI